MRRIVVPTLSFLLFLSPTAALSCVTCYYDWEKCVARTVSPYPGCQYVCECARAPAAKVNWLDKLHPGFFMEQRAKRYIVSSIIPGSPAEAAGLLPGDWILEIRGTGMSNLSCATKSWEQGKVASNSLTLKIARSEREMVLSIRLVKVRTLLDRGWSSSGIAPVSAKRVVRDYGLFEIGLRSEVRDGTRKVVAVLSGSPAESAGLRVGDRIIRQVPATGADDSASVVRIEYQREEEIRVAILSPAPLTTILRRIGTSKLPGTLTAQVQGLQP